MSQHSVKGVLVADANGLCIAGAFEVCGSYKKLTFAAKGDISSKSAGFITSMARRAQDATNGDEDATVCLEVDSKYVVIFYVLLILIATYLSEKMAH